MIYKSKTKVSVNNLLTHLLHIVYNDIKVETKSVAHPASYFRGTCVVLGEGVKWLRCDVDHSPLSSTEVKNEWSYNSSPTYAFKMFTGTSLCTRRRWVVNITPQLLNSLPQNYTGTPEIGGWVAADFFSTFGGEKNIFNLRWFEPRIIQYVSQSIYRTP